MAAPTASISELYGALELALDTVFPEEIWVRGEIRSASTSKAGHTYLDLADPDDTGRGPSPVLPVVLFAGMGARVRHVLDKARQPDLLSPGNEVRLRGKLIVYAPQSRLQLRMSAIDPSFTLGRLAAEGERLLAELSEAGLVGLNASLERPGLPRRVALVTSIASAACEDVMAVFDRSGLGIDLVRVDTRVQGATAPAAIARALRRAVSAGADLILLVRGGGSTTDLAAFDDREVALAVAHSPVPVITGIGHDVDSSIADVVAHERAPTPTAAAQLLVEWMERDLAEIEDCWERVVHSAVNDLRGADERLMRLGSRASTGARTGLESEQRRMERAARSLITLSSAVLDKGERRCERLALEVRSAAREHLATEVAQLNDLTARLGRSARSALTRLATDLDAVETEVAALDPRRMLDRGWSITRLADGSVLTDPTQAEPGALLVTRVRYGSVSSTVTPDTHNANEDAP